MTEGRFVGKSAVGGAACWRFCDCGAIVGRFEVGCS
jgi:hypothetical protein